MPYFIFLIYNKGIFYRVKYAVTNAIPKYYVAYSLYNQGQRMSVYLNKSRNLGVAVLSAGCGGADREVGPCVLTIDALVRSVGLGS